VAMMTNHFPYISNFPSNSLLIYRREFKISSSSSEIEEGRQLEELEYDERRFWFITKNNKKRWGFFCDYGSET
jgi:hypothetical protein